MLLPWTLSISFPLSLACGSFAYGASDRCEGGIVSTGDEAYVVRLKCGKPDHEERFVKETTLEMASRTASPDDAASAGSTEVARLVEIELWTYNRGPSGFVRTLVIEDGTLVRIEQGSRGVTSPGDRADQCSRGLLRRGTPDGEVLLNCGEPASKHRSIVVDRVCVKEVETRNGSVCQVFRKTSAVEERWIYDYGPERLLQIVRFRDGRLHASEASRRR